MSSSPTDPTSTTSSSTSSPSRSDAHPHAHDQGPPARVGRRAAVALIACGAISQPSKQIVDRRGWDVDVYPLPPLLHNRPELIAGEVQQLAVQLQREYADVAVAYADCGTYGALDDVCQRLAMRRLDGLHCYDVYGGADRLRQFFEEQPGTYVLTDYLVRSFVRSVIVELGLDRYPELRDDYFGNYTRVVWLAQEPDGELDALARRAADVMGLPLTRIDVGTGGLERELERLVAGTSS
jgi:Protein of unknown function (DUF1638)